MRSNRVIFGVLLGLGTILTATFVRDTRARRHRQRFEPCHPDVFRGWREWIEAEFRGAEEQIEAAAAAAFAAIYYGHDQAHVIEVARKAGREACQVSEALPLAEGGRPALSPSVQSRWRAWAEDEFGGSEGRIQAATIAALEALAHAQEQVMEAARRAAFAWNVDTQASPPEAGV